MLMRLVLVLAVLLLSACTNDPNKKPAIDEIEEFDRTFSRPPVAREVRRQNGFQGRTVSETGGGLRRRQRGFRHERGIRGSQPDLLLLLREEILAAVSRHVALDPDKVIVRMERGKHVSMLEVDVELPNGLDPGLAVAS